MNSKSYLKTFLRCIPSIVIISISWHLSSQEHVEHMPAFWNADKIVHFVCFGGLCFWMTFACRTRRISRIWIPVLIVSIYGIIDEIHQSFVPGRSCSIYDWIADTGGAVSGALTFIAFLRIVQTKIKK